MPTLLPTSVNVPSQTVSQAGPRSRGGSEPEGRSFGAALDRTRAANAQKGQDSADAAALDPNVTRKPPRGAERKNELSAEDVMAMLAPLAAPLTPAAAATTAAKGQPATGADTGVHGVKPDAATAALPDTAATAPVASTEAGVQAEAAAASGPAPDDVADAGKKTTKPDAATDRPAKPDATPPALPQTTRFAEAAAQPSTPATTGPTASAASPGAASASVGAAAGAAGSGNASDASHSSNADKPTDTSAVVASAGPKSAATPASAANANPLDAVTESGPQPSMPLQAPPTAAVARGDAPTPATPVHTVAPPVGSDEWGPAIGHQMIRMSASGQHTAELNLNPIGLGPLKVTLTMGDNQAQAMFVSAHEGVRKAVEAALPQLRTTLAEQGISLGQTSIGAESRQPGQGGAFAQQNPSRSPDQPEYPGAARGDSVMVPTRASAPANASPGTGRGLDTFA